MSLPLIERQIKLAHELEFASTEDFMFAVQRELEWVDEHLASIVIAPLPAPLPNQDRVSNSRSASIASFSDRKSKSRDLVERTLEHISRTDRFATRHHNSDVSPVARISTHDSHVVSPTVPSPIQNRPPVHRSNDPSSTRYRDTEPVDSSGHNTVLVPSRMSLPKANSGSIFPVDSNGTASNLDDVSKLMPIRITGSGNLENQPVEEKMPSSRSESTWLSSTSIAPPNNRYVNSVERPSTSYLPSFFSKIGLISSGSTLSANLASKQDVHPVSKATEAIAIHSTPAFLSREDHASRASFSNTEQTGRVTSFNSNGIDLGNHPGLETRKSGLHLTQPDTESQPSFGFTNFNKGSSKSSSAKKDKVLPSAIQNSASAYADENKYTNNLTKGLSQNSLHSLSTHVKDLRLPLSPLKSGKNSTPDEDTDEDNTLLRSTAAIFRTASQQHQESREENRDKRVRNEAVSRLMAPTFASSSKKNISPIKVQPAGRQESTGPITMKGDGSPRKAAKHNRLSAASKTGSESKAKSNLIQRSKLIPKLTPRIAEQGTRLHEQNREKKPARHVISQHQVTPTVQLAQSRTVSRIQAPVRAPPTATNISLNQHTDDGNHAKITTPLKRNGSILADQLAPSTKRMTPTPPSKQQSSLIRSALYNQVKTGQTPQRVNPYSNGLLGSVLPHNELPEIGSDDEDDDSGRILQPWASSPLLRESLQQQRRIDPESVFGPVAPLHIKEVFRSASTAGLLRPRGSSANWSSYKDGLNAKEVEDYANKMRYGK